VQLIADGAGQAADNWLITGGAGFIGVNLVSVLRSRGIAVHIRIVDDLSAGRIEELERCGTVRRSGCGSVRPMGEEPGLEFIEACATDADTALRVSEGAHVVVHLAANTSVQESISNPLADARVNVLGTLNYLEAARAGGARSFVFASSGATTGSTPPPIHEEVVCKPSSPYGVSKLAGESYCRAWHGLHGMTTAALRFSNVYGRYSGRKGSVVALFLRRALAGQPWILNGDGQQTRDFIFADDLVEAILKSAALENAGEVFQISTGRETSIADLAKMMSEILEREAGLRPVVEHGPPLKGEIPRNYADNSKARSILGWQPRVRLEEGVRETANWFLMEHP
jgi:UDP-glucose 4-epimerase